MKIYWIKAQAPRRVLALVKHLKIDAELIWLDARAGALRSAEYTALNPNRKAPVLVDGETVLWESTAIMAWLCIRQDSDMWPAAHPAEQVEVLRWLSWGDSHWSEVVSPFYFEHVVKATFEIGLPDRESLKDKVAPLNRFARVLDAHLEGRDHVVCGRLTIADFQLASMARYWREAEMPLESFPNIVRWLDGLEGIPAWADPWPKDND